MNGRGAGWKELKRRGLRKSVTVVDGVEEWIRDVERMSVPGKTKEARLCRVFCFAESAAEEHREAGSGCHKKNNRISPLAAVSAAELSLSPW